MLDCSIRTVFFYLPKLIFCKVCRITVLYKERFVMIVHADRTKEVRRGRWR